MRMPPQPGTAVKEPARSIVSRMYLRFSMARSLMETTFAGFMVTKVNLLSRLCQVLCDTKTEHTLRLRWTYACAILHSVFDLSRAGLHDTRRDACVGNLRLDPNSSFYSRHRYLDRDRPARRNWDGRGCQTARPSRPAL